MIARLRRFLLSATVVGLSTLCLSAPAADSPRTVKNHAEAFASELESVYRRYLNAGRAGDVARFRAATTAQVQKDMATVTPQIVRGLTQDALEPNRDSFVRADLLKERARLIYSKDLPDRVTWQGVAFSKERGEWRISAVVETIDPKNMPPEVRKMLGKTGLEELLSHHSMQLSGPGS